MVKKRARGGGEREAFFLRRITGSIVLLLFWLLLLLLYAGVDTGLGANAAAAAGATHIGVKTVLVPIDLSAIGTRLLWTVVRFNLNQSSANLNRYSAT